VNATALPHKQHPAPENDDSARQIFRRLFSHAGLLWFIVFAGLVSALWWAFGALPESKAGWAIDIIAVALVSAILTWLGAIVALSIEELQGPALDARIASAESDLKATLQTLDNSEGDSAANQVRFGAAVQPAWDIARSTLERYWRRNLTQNFYIFVASVIATGAGFAVMLWAVASGIREPSATLSAAIGALSGILTQFVGATFLLIYRSTIDQANEFNRTIERINSVGMAWFILQSMPDDNPDLLKAKNEARLALILRAAEPKMAPQKV
jgi:hypothetical protein